MLWLPKWLQADGPPEPDNVHRRTFLMAGAAAAASVLLPSPLPGWREKLFSAGPIGVMGVDDVHGREAFIAYYRQELILRTANPRYHFRLDGITGDRLLLDAVEVPTLPTENAYQARRRLLAETPPENRYVLVGEGRWEDKDGRPLQVVKP